MAKNDKNLSKIAEIFIEEVKSMQSKIFGPKVWKLAIFIENSDLDPKIDQ